MLLEGNDGKGVDGTGTDVSSVGDGVEARSLLAFIVCFHGVYRIADGLEGAMVKCFRILVEWLVIV